MNAGTTKAHSNKNWINQYILYGPKSKGGLCFINAHAFFFSLKTFWLQRYVTDRLDDHWTNIIDKTLKVRRNKRDQVLTWRTEGLTCILSSSFQCIQGFLSVWMEFITCFHLRPTTTHKDLLHSPLSFNAGILKTPQAKDFTRYSIRKKTSLNP